jgi:hypothetical protein
MNDEDKTKEELIAEILENLEIIKRNMKGIDEEL